VEDVFVPVQEDFFVDPQESRLAYHELRLIIGHKSKSFYHGLSLCLPK
jgi:hypothetical protein